MRPLARSFFVRAPERVARSLIGTTLVHGDRRGVIVETEAYLDGADLASHARFGQTPRNQPMFEQGGTAYVFLCYGIHHLFNIVTGPRGRAGAVLIRGVAIEGGCSDMGRGPGKVGRALALDLRHNGIDLLAAGSAIQVLRSRQHYGLAIARGPRIGVDYAGPWAKRPLRFWLEGHPSVS